MANINIWLRLRQTIYLTPKLSVLLPSRYKYFNKSFHPIPHQRSLDMFAYFEENIAQGCYTQGVQDGINFSGMFDSANGNGFRNAVLGSSDNESNYEGYSWQVCYRVVYYPIVESISYDEDNVNADTSFREKWPIKIIKNKIVLFQFSLTYKRVYIVRYTFLVEKSNKNKFGFFWNSVLHFVFIK